MAWQVSLGAVSITGCGRIIYVAAFTCANNCQVLIKLFILIYVTGTHMYSQTQHVFQVNECNVTNLVVKLLFSNRAKQQQTNTLSH